MGSGGRAREGTTLRTKRETAGVQKWIENEERSRNGHAHASRSRTPGEGTLDRENKL